ncbi:hypothetical protein CDAR_577861 [Caerostris darwini]|uniref:Uncharacterized protein n=1 Tax=Caerostris darwini TaxID=1538125 RepID=A0AAV4RKL8_9ARAC|nr:hypothetical protein CDAR_577861 [Caerostris darwini]
MAMEDGMGNAFMSDEYPLLRHPPHRTSLFGPTSIPLKNNTRYSLSLPATLGVGCNRNLITRGFCNCLLSLKGGSEVRLMVNGIAVSLPSLTHTRYANRRGERVCLGVKDLPATKECLLKPPSEKMVWICWMCVNMETDSLLIPFRG